MPVAIKAKERARKREGAVGFFMQGRGDRVEEE
jgi:hypothetical protein